MTDAERVREALADGRLLHPDEGTANTVDLAQATAQLAGAPITVSAKARTLAEMIGHHDHIVFVLVDGLGMNLVETLPADTFFRARFAAELRAVFPSSTAPALTSIATARWPAEHAVTGWWTHLPEAGVTATILPYVERFSEKPLNPLLVPPSYAFPVEAAARSFSSAFMMFSPKAIAGSVYSRYSSGDAPFGGYGKLTEGIDAVVQRVGSAKQPTYSYLYLPQVDYEEHLHGPHSPQASKALSEVQAQLVRLTEGIAGRARVVITADHGQITVGNVEVITRGDPLVRMLAVPPSGDGRAPLFHVRTGARDAFAEAFRARYGDRFALLTTEEAEALRLFGPVPLSEETRRRVGDFVGVALTCDVIFHEPKKDDELRGHHGGLTPDEMRIPLILA